jgi:hypothetical protein
MDKSIAKMNQYIRHIFDTMQKGPLYIHIMGTLVENLTCLIFLFKNEHEVYGANYFCQF